MMENLEEEISQYVEAIWKSVLGLDVVKSETTFQPDHLDHALASCVHITGEWQGIVALHCPATLARKFTSIMFAVEEESAEMQDIQDALGELANMTGGNLKALFPGVACFSGKTILTITALKYL